MLLQRLFCCYIYFSATHKIPTRVFQCGCGLHILPTLPLHLSHSKSIQMNYSLKPLHPWILNFICSMIRLQGYRIIKLSVVENSRWPLLLKIAKLIKSSFSPERLSIFDWNFVWSISRTLMLIDIKMKKICSGIRSQWPFENLRRP